MKVMQSVRERVKLMRRAELLRKGLPASSAIASMPGKARWNGALGQALDLMGMVCEEMQAYQEERSESWKEGERGTALLERIEELEEIRECLEGYVALG